MYIFLDTTCNFTLGLLDEEFNWLSFEKYTTKRTSEILHEKIYNLLEKYSLKLEEIETFFAISGPGSYTGMRVSEGFNQILELEGKKIISFPSYFLAKFIQVDWDYWVYPAFKSEVYTRSYKGTEKLIDIETFKTILKSGKLLTYGENYIDSSGITNTEFVLKAYSKELFPSLLADSPRELPFYFRPQEVEFQKSIK